MKKKVIAALFILFATFFLLVDVMYSPAQGKAIYFAFIFAQLSYLVR